jgi:hypothetical protein
VENKEQTIVELHKNNFNTLKRAFKNNEIALMDCILKSTGEHVATICAVYFDRETQEYEFTPFCIFINGNPFELLEPPLK